MLLPKRGFYHPVAILVLAAITLSFAVIFYLNSSVFFKAPEKTPESVTTPSPSPSQKSSVDETVNWKTYTDNKENFSFKYPNDWSTRKNDHLTSVDYSLLSDEFKLNEDNKLEEEPKNGAKMDIFVYPNQPLSSVTSGQIIAGSDTTYSIKASNIKSLTISGQPAQEFDFVAIERPTLTGTKVQLSKGNKLYVLAITYSSNSFKTIFDQILSTFKFLN